MILQNICITHGHSDQDGPVGDHTWTQAKYEHCPGHRPNTLRLRRKYEWILASSTITASSHYILPSQYVRFIEIPSHKTSYFLTVSNPEWTSAAMNHPKITQTKPKSFKSFLTPSHWHPKGLPLCVLSLAAMSDTLNMSNCKCASGALCWRALACI